MNLKSLVVVKHLNPDQEAKSLKSNPNSHFPEKVPEVFGSLKSIFELSEESETLPYPLSIYQRSSHTSYIQEEVPFRTVLFTVTM